MACGKCFGKNTSFYTYKDEECLDCGARRHANGWIWHNARPSSSGNQVHPLKGHLFVDKEDNTIKRRFINGE